MLFLLQTGKEVLHMEKEFTPEEQKRERAVLVGLSCPRFTPEEDADERTMAELAALTETAGGEPVAMEDSYFTEELYDAVKNLPPETSLAHTILSSDGVDIERVDMKIVLREATEYERTELKLQHDERVAELTRWTFSDSKAVNFVRFIVCERFVQTPFGE